MPRPANPSRAPLLVGQCGEGGGATERPRGTVADVRYWPRAATAASVQADLFSRRLGPAGDAGWAELTRPRGEVTRVASGGGVATGAGPGVLPAQGKPPGWEHDLHWGVFDFATLEQLLLCLGFEVAATELAEPYHMVVVGRKLEVA